MGLTLQSLSLACYNVSVIFALHRSTSGLGKGDGINNHTDKWLDVSMAGCVQAIGITPSSSMTNAAACPCAHTSTIQTHRLGGPGCACSWHVGFQQLSMGTTPAYTIQLVAAHQITKALRVTHVGRVLSQGDIKSPLEWIQEAEPIKVSGPVVASYGSKQATPLLPRMCSS